ncbi:hypothetical protein BN3456_01194 [Clostridium sp. C105KSO13]|nr:hypothetical protein BN3456_01194 [Clostridium sp. C105KSO13]
MIIWDRCSFCHRFYMRHRRKKSLFESALKTNPCLEFAVITACLRTSKESIFTGLNNLHRPKVKLKIGLRAKVLRVQCMKTSRLSAGAVKQYTGVSCCMLCIFCGFRRFPGEHERQSAHRWKWTDRTAVRQLLLSFIPKIRNGTNLQHNIFSQEYVPEGLIR